MNPIYFVFGVLGIIILFLVIYSAFKQQSVKDSFDELLEMVR